MDSYFFIFVTINILIILCIVWLQQQSVDKNALIEPFTRKFFNQIKKTHFIGIDQSQLLGNEFELIENIKEMVPFNINTMFIKKSMDRYKLLNDNENQLILSRSIEIYSLLYKLTPLSDSLNLDNVRFVCALNSIAINILTNNLSIFEFGDLKGSGLTINVGEKGSSDYLIAMDLLLEYQIIVGHDVFLTYYDANQVVEHYGKDVQVVILNRTHPDMTVLYLVNTKLTRFVEIIKYNNGNIYQMGLDEEKFYKSHPYYTKSIIEKEFFKNYYTNLVLEEQTFYNGNKRKSLFINTISLKYYLLSNTKTPDLSIYQLLLNMKLKINHINKLPFVESPLNSVRFNDFTLPMETHLGARKFYTSSGLYTNISQPSCLMIDGRCDMNMLKDYHLYYDYGPTFDQIYNHQT
jgi:TRAP-type uncharacterized transport system substrate-binding protein